MDLVIIKLNKLYLILYIYYNIKNLLLYIFSYYYEYHIDNEKILKYLILKNTLNTLKYI